jgi:taurine--2-oxoglutarate transaminase
VPPPGYLEGVRALADKHGIVLIFDEVMCGFGRTGEWFAFQGFGVTPDLITFAKGVNSGYVPAGGVVINESIANAFETQVFPGGLTYSGHPLAMASIVGAIDAMEAEGVIENAAMIGRDHLAGGLEDLAAKHPLIGEVRGLGVFWALDLVDDAESRDPVSGATVAQLKKELLARGLLPFAADNRIHVVPPCIVTPDEVARALSIYDEAFTAVEATRS